MGFITPALLGGALLIGVPILLHLIMRREAKHLLFPALRFVERRRSLNQHRLRLRHWLLLAMRCALIALLAMALARPVLRGSAVAGMEGAPVATVLVFDNSLRMEYQHRNQSRLEQAKDLAGWLLAQLPPDSPVTVIDRSGQHRSTGSDRDSAELRVERLATSAAVRPLADALRAAADWLADRPEFRGEIYVFTDLASTDWPQEMLAEFRGRLDDLPGANVYLIDVGAERPRNVGLGPLRLSSQQLASGGLLRIETDLLVTGDIVEEKVSGTFSSTGSSSSSDKAAETEEKVPDTFSARQGNVVVELYVNEGLGQPVVRGQKVVSPNGEPTVPIEFSLSGLGLGTHQGFLRLVANDPLAFDDVRYFTVEVRPPSKVLLLGRRASDTLFLHEALAPRSATGLVHSKFECHTARVGQWQEIQFADYDAVCLVDPPPMASGAWQALADFAHAGGGVGVFLGRNARSSRFNTPDPQQLLPAKLRMVSAQGTYLRPLGVEHPALAELRDFADLVPWSEFPVFKYWELEAGDEPAHVVAPFANGQPALVERVIGSGRVLMLATSLSDPAHDDPWNLLPTAPDPWPFLALAHGIAEHLAGATETQLNYTAGQSVLLRLTPEEQALGFYVLQIPGTSAVRQSFSPGQQDLSITSTEAVGNYRLRAGGEQGGLDRGFSVNAPPEMSQLERTSTDQIAEALGEDRVRAARTREEIEVRVGHGRLGRELFPLLILAVALILGAEQLLANRFYRGAS